MSNSIARRRSDYRPQFCSLFLKSRQFGIGIPRGAEALIHLRTLFEQSLQEDDESAIAILDLDLRNAFPSSEWDSIRNAVEQFIPELLP